MLTVEKIVLPQMTKKKKQIEEKRVTNCLRIRLFSSFSDTFFSLYQIRALDEIAVMFFLCPIAGTACSAPRGLDKEDKLDK